MGASEFMTSSKGKTAKEAFANAKETARYECGHSGYTGTIAEKRSFVIIHPSKEFEQDPIGWAEKLLNNDDARIVDKWGPAGCVQVGDGEWLFFGLASS